MSDASFRPKFGLEQARALYRLVNSATYSPEDLHEAMVVERLKKTIKQFLILNDSDAKERMEKELKKDFSDFDWDAEQKKFDEQFKDFPVAKPEE